jgi:hypothetical protein
MRAALGGGHFEQLDPLIHLVFADGFGVCHVLDVWIFFSSTQMRHIRSGKAKLKPESPYDYAMSDLKDCFDRFQYS